MSSDFPNLDGLLFDDLQSSGRSCPQCGFTHAVVCGEVRVFLLEYFPDILVVIGEYTCVDCSVTWEHDIRVRIADILESTIKVLGPPSEGLPF